MQKPKLGIQKLRGSDIEWSNPYGKQITHFIGCIKSPNVKNYFCNCKKIGTTFDAKPTIYISSTNERETQVGGVVVVKQIMWRWT
jgi:hypothetical protein